MSTTPSGRRPRVLYLAFYFPPTRASGVFRARATANHLAEQGWDVTVHTAPRKFFTEYIDSCDDTLEATVHPDVRVVRPGMSFYRWTTDIRAYGRFRGTFPALATALHRFQTERLFPEHYASWIPRVVARALLEHRRRRYDVVVATGNPFASFAAAWVLHKVLRIPYVVDYRDAWTFNQFTEELKYPPGHDAWTWEERVLREASEVVFVNDGMRQWYAERYPFAADAMTVVPNGWEPEFLDGLAPATAPPERPLRFGYVGTVTDAMPIEELFAGWRIAREHPALAGATLHVHGHLGFFPGHVPVLLDRMPTEEGIGVSYDGPADKADVAAVYDSLDVLLFWVPGARYVTSGKVFEYMATGKPIVSVHDPQIAAVDVLQGHPRWVPTPSLSAQDVAASLVAGAEMARSTTQPDLDRAREHAARYTRSAVFTPFEERLRELTRA
ncbi:glycosyltransferase [Aquipuribacter sp. MA13-6]|uniref:glycosyltransferase n=1 Tax=unclassified Aquipuribacter TaxID=2635084 RepID=UPI003EEF2D53